MSRNYQNTRNQRSSAPPARKPFCKVCCDAGKSESDYTSHYVRSLPDRQGNSKVTCPTLLNTECRYCYELGHTAKFCPVLAARKKDDERREREDQRRTREAQKPAEKPRGPTNAYNLLRDDSDDETETKKPAVVEDFPALGAPSQRVATNSYASAAAKPVPITSAPRQQALPAGFQVLQKGATYEKTEVKVGDHLGKRITNWAEESSDEEDEEEHVDNSAW